MRAHPFADDQKLVDAQLFGNLRAGAPRYDDRLDLRQVPLEIIRELPKQHLTDDRTQDRVTQKLEPFIRGQPVVGPRRMRQRFLEERQVLELDSR